MCADLHRRRLSLGAVSRGDYYMMIAQGRLLGVAVPLPLPTMEIAGRDSVNKNARRRLRIVDTGRDFGSLILKNKAVVVLCVCVAVFVMLLEDVLEGDLLRIDAMAYGVIVERLRFEWLTPIMESFSALATPVVLLVMLLLVAAFAPGRRPGACCTLNLVLVVILNLLIKGIVQRPRPEGISLVTEHGFSFPSGHSMAAMAFFGLLVWLIWHYEKDKLMRIACCVALSVVIVMVGVSRIYLGVHYASDVIGGFCVSLAWLTLYTRIVAPLFLDPALARDGR